VRLIVPLGVAISTIGFPRLFAVIVN
jgi:hypothetical protein